MQITSLATSSLSLSPFYDDRTAAQAVPVHLLNGIFGVSAVLKFYEGIAYNIVLLVTNSIFHK